MSQINSHRYKFYQNKNLLKCPVCKATSENEFHVIFECHAYNDIRKKLPINIISTKTVQSMITLLKANEYRICLARYLLDMFSRRLDYVNS